MERTASNKGRRNLTIMGKASTIRHRSRSHHDLQTTNFLDYLHNRVFPMKTISPLTALTKNLMIMSWSSRNPPRKESMMMTSSPNSPTRTFTMMMPILMQSIVKLPAIFPTSLVNHLVTRL